MPNSHDLLPTSSSPTHPSHPPVFTYNRHSTGIWIPVQNINILITKSMTNRAFYYKIQISVTPDKIFISAQTFRWRLNLWNSRKYESSFRYFFLRFLVPSLDHKVKCVRWLWWPSDLELWTRICSLECIQTAWNSFLRRCQKLLTLRWFLRYFFYWFGAQFLQNCSNPSYPIQFRPVVVIATEDSFCRWADLLHLLASMLITLDRFLFPCGKRKAAVLSFTARRLPVIRKSNIV